MITSQFDSFFDRTGKKENNVENQNNVIGTLQYT